MDAPLGHQAVRPQLLECNIQSIPYPLSGPSTKSTFLQFRDKGVMQNSVKCLVHVQVDEVSSLIVEDYQVYQAWFALSEATLLS